MRSLFSSYLWSFLWISFGDGNHTTHMHNAYKLKKVSISTSLPPVQLTPSEHWGLIQFKLTNLLNHTQQNIFYFFPFRNPFSPPKALEHCSVWLALLKTDLCKWHDRLIWEEGKINFPHFQPKYSRCSVLYLLLDSKSKYKTPTVW